MGWRFYRRIRLIPGLRLNLSRSGPSLELCLNLGDGVNQAANLASSTTSIPSRNLAPLTTFGNWF